MRGEKEKMKARKNSGYAVSDHIEDILDMVGKGK
jgi:hypothetical protein